VCAMDVLEHLESFHLIVEEMVRCMAKTCLISLPNSAAEIAGIVLNKSKFQKKSHQGYFSKPYLHYYFTYSRKIN